MPNTLASYIDNIFDELQPFSNSLTKYISTTPALNVREHKDRYEITLAIPGLDPNQVKVELNEHVLTFRYAHETNSKDNDNSEMIREEYRHYSFVRSVGLPKNVDPDSIKANYKNGLLKVEVMKTPETQPKEIKIETVEE